MPQASDDLPDPPQAFVDALNNVLAGMSPEERAGAIAMIEASEPRIVAAIAAGVRQHLGIK